MPDSTTASIDRFFDLVDSVVDNSAHVLNRQKQAATRTARKAQTIDTSPTVKVAKPAPAPSKETAIARRQFRIVEAIDATTGQPTFVVTNTRGDSRAECSSRAMAEKILHALETA